MGDSESMRWLLERIRFLEGTTNRPATHQNIWQGSYDVWFCEQDRINAINMPKFRMQTAVDAGMIKSEKINMGKFIVEVWSLTEAGENFLKENRRNDGE